MFYTGSGVNLTRPAPGTPLPRPMRVDVIRFDMFYTGSGVNLTRPAPGTPLQRPWESRVDGIQFDMFYTGSGVNLTRLAPGPPLPRPILPRDRSVLDRLMEYLIGDGPQNRFALICTECQSHNGMALREEFEYIGNICILLISTLWFWIQWSNLHSAHLYIMSLNTLVIFALRPSLHYEFDWIHY